MLKFFRAGGALLVVILCVLPVALRAEKPFSFADTPGQLPKGVVPRHYTLRIQPDLEDRTTFGTARIEIDVFEPVTSIVLNVNQLVIDSAELVDDPAAPQALTPVIDTDRQTLALPVALAPGPHVISLAFRGKIGSTAEGFFVDKYPTSSGDKLMLGTQFEPTDARRVFPCWDEPVYRASYDITLIVPEKLMAVSNMPIRRERASGGGLKEVVFERTPAMSSYLVALYAGEFESVEGEQDGVQLRILCTEGKRASAAYALEATKKILAYYNEYFGVRYPLPKLDQIAVPNAFATFGAMENWGCITYIDTALLYDPAASAPTTRQAVFTTIAHEIAHQWFGNLVTMAWWDNLWLNEGFASWMGTKCSDALNPDWELWVRAAESKEGALALDARRTTHPIQQPIANESQANDAFDTISYRKGQGFLRMLEAYLGETAFRDGLRLYLSRHKFLNTTTADLWAALGEASGKPVVALAAGWTEQPGFPVVQVSGIAVDGQRALRLEQARFSVNDPEAAPLQWQVPVLLANTAAPGTASAFLLAHKSGVAPWPAGAGTPKANAGNTGFFRVLYDDPLTDALRRTVATLPVADQLNLLGDSWALAEAGRQSLTAWFDLVEQLHASSAPPIWEHVLEKLVVLDRYQLGRPGRRAFHAWAVQMLKPQLAALGWEPRADESALAATLRAKLISALGRYRDPAVIDECTRRFQAYVADPASLPGSLRGPVLEVAGRYATRETYDQLHAVARTARTTEEKRRAYDGMRAVLDPALARQTLDLTLGSELSATEAARNVMGVASNDNAALAWEFARAHTAALLQTTTFFGRNQYLPNIAQYFTDAARADELEALVREHLPADSLTEAEKGADLVRLNAAVKERELPAIDSWIKERVQLPE
jgi:aminopeptidase N